MSRSKVNPFPATGQALDRRQSCRGIGTASDRRNTCRYRPLNSVAAVSWKERGSHAELPVELDNISAVGCMIKTPTRLAPQAGESIWFRATGMETLGWIEGRVISIKKPFLRKYEVRIGFVSTLPFQAFKKVVYGAVDDEQVEAPRPAHETDQWWR